MLDNLLGFFEDYGLLGLIVMSFIESSFFPIPPDFLLIPLCLAIPGKALIYALLCTLASVAGACLGYLLGKCIGQPLLHRFTSAQRVDKVESMFNRYGAWAMFLAGLTPIPYKVFTISAGIFSLKIPTLILASLLGRGLRFFTVAILIMAIGEHAVNFISNNFEWLTAVMGIFIILCYMVYKRKELLAKWLYQTASAIIAPFSSRLDKKNDRKPCNQGKK